MSLKFFCSNCNNQIVVKYLKVGEVAKCWKCGTMNTVPASATFTDEISYYEVPASSAEKKIITKAMIIFPSLNKASRLIRLAAVVIDIVLFYAIGYLSIGVAYLLGDIERYNIVGYVFVGSILATQVKLLTTHGQTIGKTLLHIMIVKRSTWQNGGFFTNVIFRYGIFLVGMLSTYLIVQVSPPLAFIMSMLFNVDALFIFRKDKRCLHDLIAGTEVVKALSVASEQLE